MGLCEMRVVQNTLAFNISVSLYILLDSIVPKRLQSL